MTVRYLGYLTALVLASAPNGLAEDDNAAEYKKAEGSWTITSQESDGEAVPDPAHLVGELQNLGHPRMDEEMDPRRGDVDVTAGVGDLGAHRCAHVHLFLALTFQKLGCWEGV